MKRPLILFLIATATAAWGIESVEVRLGEVDAMRVNINTERKSCFPEESANPLDELAGELIWVRGMM